MGSNTAQMQPGRFQRLKGFGRQTLPLQVIRQ
jgi:hypothetical protein